MPGCCRGRRRQQQLLPLTPVVWQGAAASAGTAGGGGTAPQILPVNAHRIKHDNHWRHQHSRVCTPWQVHHPAEFNRALSTGHAPPLTAHRLLSTAPAWFRWLSAALCWLFHAPVAVRPRAVQAPSSHKHTACPKRPTLPTAMLLRAGTGLVASGLPHPASNKPHPVPRPPRPPDLSKALHVATH
jgi:hypothetical protein